MDQVLGPIIGITLVLMAVFGPTAFLGGITGQLYRQFALTIAATALISAINAVTLKPAQCAVWLRKPKERKNFFFRGFNYVYDRVELAYTVIIRRALRWRWAMIRSPYVQSSNRAGQKCVEFGIINRTASALHDPAAEPVVKARRSQTRNFTRH